MILAALLLALPSISPTVAAESTDTTHCFPETGACIRAPFLDYWQSNGAVPIFGLPLADAGFEMLEDRQSHLVQYFERARLELHWIAAEEGRGTPLILLGQFGRLIHPADPPVPPLIGAVYFAETGHNVNNDFFAYWQANGGLAQFGYPLSEEFDERLEDGQVYAVQYFERARFERHAKAGGILLGHFGRTFYRRSLLSPRNNPRFCGLGDLSAAMNRGAGLGTTYIQITLTNVSGAPCSLIGFLHPELLDDAGRVLPSHQGFAPAFNGLPTQTPVALLPGQAVRAMITWGNGCPDGVPFDPLPASALRLSLPNGEGAWTFQTRGPHCGRTGEAKGMNISALTPALDDGPLNLANNTLDSYYWGIQQRDYRGAYAILSPEMQAQLGPYERFAAGFATTVRASYAKAAFQQLDSRTTRFTVRLVAPQTDGTTRYFIGSYDIQLLPERVSASPAGRIVAADIAEEFP